MAEMTINLQTVKLIDQSRSVLAIVQVVDEGNYYGGTIDLCYIPADLRALFVEFEELVNGQTFSLLDEIDKKIEALSIKAVFDNGDEVCISDLQVYPSNGQVSFKLAAVPIQNASPATHEDPSWPR